MERVAVVAASRSAIGSFQGMYAQVPALELGSQILSATIDKAGCTPELIDQVIVGNVLSAGLGQNISRQIAIQSGIPKEHCAFGVNMVCGSGLKSIALAADTIRMGRAGIVAAGGVENMSMTPYAVPTARSGARMGDSPMVDLLIKDGLWESFNNYHMGCTAENLADLWKIDRRAMDSFALDSQHKAAAARDSGRFRDEIEAIQVTDRRGNRSLLETDEHIRPDTSMEKLAKLRPAFRKEGRVSAGNSSGINDGAAFVVLASESRVKEHGLEPLVWLAGQDEAGVDPALMGYAPVPAIGKALKASGWQLNDLDLLEINEAFASQCLAVFKGLEQEHGTLDREKINVNGGAIALGHPIGASGTRIFVSLVHEMKKRSAQRGLASLCIGGGMAVALLVEADQ